MNRLLTSLVFMLGWALSPLALAASSQFTFQGSLTDAAHPASGSYDFRVELQTRAGAIVAGPLQIDDVVVADGVFAIALDFGPVIASGDYQLQVDVRPGTSTGAYTLLSPPTPIDPVPQANVVAMAIEAVSVSTGSIDSASVVDGSLGAVDFDSSEIQRRVGSGCGPGQAIAGIAADGTVNCVFGPTGPIGPSGPEGLAGPEGMTGPAGPAGASGPAGPQGPVGPQGATGLAGTQGPEGPAGPQGPVGANGETGPVGAAGPVGSTGETGMQGPDGPVGPAGSQGSTGPVGPVGPTGAAGPMGATGPVGPVGPVGLRGLQGSPGATGATGQTGARGPTGASGPRGPTGPYRGAAEATVENFSTPQDFIFPTLARLNGYRHDSADDIEILDTGSFTYFRIAGSGTYQVSYSVTYRMDAAPDVLAHTTWLAYDPNCNLSNLPSINSGFAFAETSAIVNLQEYYVVSSSEIVELEWGDCLALKGDDNSGSQPGDKAEMVRGSVIIRRLR